LNITITFVKSKILLLTDSERVAKAKGEKVAQIGVEIETEILSLQAVRA